MPRCRRIIFTGYPHHVTHRGNGGQPVFRVAEDHEQFLSLLAHYSTKFECHVLGYCLMSNHVHLVLIPKAEDSLGKCMHGLAFLYAQKFNATHHRNGHLWESRYYSCPVDTDEHLWRLMRYVYRNPVRAGMVATPWDYRWSSARANSNGMDDPHLKLHTWLDPANIKAYSEYLQWDEQPDAFRQATRRGTPFGNFEGLL